MSKIKKIVAIIILCIFCWMVVVAICILPYAMFYRETGSYLTAAKYLAESIAIMALVIGLVGWALNTMND